MTSRPGGPAAEAHTTAGGPSAEAHNIAGGPVAEAHNIAGGPVAEAHNIAGGPVAEAHNTDRHPRSSPFHDVLLIRKQFVPGQRPLRLERFAIDKTTGSYINENAGQKLPVRPDAEGYRPTLNLGTTGAGTEEDPARGPALSTLPLHPSPAASSSCTCYVVNPENLNYDTAWTAEEWNDSPGGFNAPARVGEDRFALLVASPAGKVYYLEKKLPAGTRATSVNHDDQDFSFKEIDLRGETEIWAQLRSGCVAGRAFFERAPGAKRPHEKVVPLVNIDSLSPRPPEAGTLAARGMKEHAK